MSRCSGTVGKSLPLFTLHIGTKGTVFFVCKLLNRCVWLSILPPQFSEINLNDKTVSLLRRVLLNKYNADFGGIAMGNFALPGWADERWVWGVAIRGGRSVREGIYCECWLHCKKWMYRYLFWTNPSFNKNSLADAKPFVWSAADEEQVCSIHSASAVNTFVIKKNLNENFETC